MPRPGRRGPADGRKVRGVTGDEHQVWAELGFYRHSLFIAPEGSMRTKQDGQVEPISGEKGPTVHYMVLGPNGPRVSVDLTHMTHEELEVFRKFWHLAFTVAEPIVLARDKEAADAFQRGDDSLTRVHRAVPQLVVRSRAKRAYDQVLRFGLEHVLAGGWERIRALVPAGGQGDGVAPEQEGHAEPEDDATAAD